MTSILESKLAGIVHKAARNIFLSATLTRDVPGTGGTAIEPPTPTTATFACKAIEQKYSTGTYGMGLVNDLDVNILILAGSLATTPQVGDRITIRDKTVTVVPMDAKMAPVSTDPARATWSLRCS